MGIGASPDALEGAVLPSVGAEVEHVVSFSAEAAERMRWPVRLGEVDDVSMRLRPSRRRLDIMSALATGCLPWGVADFFEPKEHPSLSLCGRRYVLCCGHVLERKEAQAFVDAGLLWSGPPDRFGRPTLVITAAGGQWLAANWSASPWRRKKGPI